MSRVDEDRTDRIASLRPPRAVAPLTTRSPGPSPCACDADYSLGRHAAPAIENWSMA